MNQRQLKIGLVGLVTAAVAGATFSPAPAQAALDDRSLAEVLAADKGYDRNWHDFDILEKAVTTVLKAKPNSPVSVLADGDTRLTAFLPTDAAFRRLVKDLSGKQPRTERATFNAVAKVADVDTLEAVLLYHVVPQRLNAKKVLKSDGAKLKTAANLNITVKVTGKKVKLIDKDRDAQNPRVVAVDINKGNKQIAHAINRVLRPIDL
ncbi:fasciclin domain-containing protein [Nocardioides sp. zg-ZUI104]|uniref:fasciclin domain-containing protein n=1 Tax=Nocardioides faecalis TaxID=2803858 RepID=UPI001BCDA539|nr:fasciclin domain-containing protein [Nocardioides faecalis]MBS4754695.1 fasciclin domain-containing protein [Nocardioides faecalis]